MTALKRSSKSPRKRVPARSAPLSRAKISAPFRTSGTSSCEQALGEPLHEGGLADAGVAHEDGVVLAPPAEHLEGALHLGTRPMRGSSLPSRARSVRFDRVGGEGIAGGPGASSLALARRRTDSSASAGSRAGPCVTPWEM